MTITEALAALVAELEEGDIPDPLRESFTLALVWHDMACIAGEPVPAAVAAILDGPAVAALPVAEVARWLPTLAD